MLRFVEKDAIFMVYLEDSLVKMRLGGVTSNSLKNICKANFECMHALRRMVLEWGDFIHFIG